MLNYRLGFFIFGLATIMLLAGNANASLIVNGTIYNSTEGPMSGINVTIQFEQPGRGLITALNSTWSNTTDANGVFILNITNTTFQEGGTQFGYIYRISMSDVNTTKTAYLENVSWVMPDLPELPAIALQYEFTGGSFYMSKGGNINFSAMNASGQALFDLMVLDADVGKPVGGGIASNILSKTYNLPRNRNYTAVVMAQASAAPPLSFSFTINDTNIMQGSSIIGSENSNGILYANFTANISMTPIQVRGYINVSGDQSAVNYTNVMAYSYISNFVTLGMPPQYCTVNLTVGNYTCSLLGSSNGVSYLLAGFALNRSGDLYNMQHFGGFQNVTVNTTNIFGLNFTLLQLAGNYTTTTTFNSTAMNGIVVKGSSFGGAESSQQAGFGEVDATYYYTGLNNPVRVRWVGGPDSSGVIYIPMLKAYDGNITFRMFSQRFAPLQKPLNITNATNITVTQKTFNFEKLGRGQGNYSGNGNITGGMQVQFYKYNTTCNRQDPPAGCRSGGPIDSGAFSPFKFMSGGNKINIMSQQGGTNTSVYYIGANLIASGPPDSQFDDTPDSNTTGNSAFSQVWRFGSQAPKVYESVYIRLGYDDRVINESSKINVTMGVLYDDNWNVVWNATLNPYATNVSPGYSDFNQSWLNISYPMICTPNYINTTGCGINTTTNLLWFNVPHFTGGGFGIGGGAVATASSSSTTTSSGSSSGGSTTGGGAAGETAQSFAFDTITANQEVQNIVTKTELAVTEVDFTLSQNTNNVKLSVTKLDAAPATVTTQPAGTAYKYLQISLSGAGNEIVSSGKIKFTIDKTWATENGADKNTVKLNRWVGNAWQVLATSYTGETDTAYTYEATTPGFSVFAITATTSGKPVVATNNTASEASKKSAVSGAAKKLPTVQPAGSNAQWIAIAVAIMIAIAIGITQMRRSKRT